MDQDLLTLTVQLDGGPGLDMEELDAQTQRLRAELLDLDVHSIEPIRAGDAPPGTRAADVLAIGGLLVTLARSTGTLKTLLGVIQSWLHTQPVRSVELQIDGDTLKLSSVSSADQAKLVDLFVQRHLVDNPAG